MGKYRRDRINGEIARELADIMREVKDPRVSGAFISIVRVDCTADLKFCKIFYSLIGGDEDGSVAKGIRSANGFIRSQLAKRLNMRITPELTFVADNSLEHGAEINRLMNKVEEELAEADRRDAFEAEAAVNSENTDKE